MLLEKICKELGVEIGEEWKDKVGDTYKITKEGLFYMFSLGDWEEVSSLEYMRLLKGELKPVWQPEHGEYYFVPRPDFKSGWKENYWVEDSVDYHRLNNDLVFKTKEEAIECANKMLGVVQNDL